VKFNCTNCQYVEQTPVVDAKGVPVIGMAFYACKRFPPTAVMTTSRSGALQTGSAFPPVSDKMICGEYHQKEPVKNAVKMEYCEHGAIRDFCPECAPLR